MAINVILIAPSVLTPGALVDLPDGTQTSVAADGSVTVDSGMVARLLNAGFRTIPGAASGSGGAVTQITNRSTGVTLNKACGQITTVATSLAAEVAAKFTLTNSLITATSLIVLNILSGTNGGNTKVFIQAVAAGSCDIVVANDNASGGTAETGVIIIGFSILANAFTS